MEDHEIERLISAAFADRVLDDLFVSNLLTMIRKKKLSTQEVRVQLLALRAELQAASGDTIASLVLSAIFRDLAEGKKPWKVSDENWIWICRAPLDTYY